MMANIPLIAAVGGPTLAAICAWALRRFLPHRSLLAKVLVSVETMIPSDPRLYDSKWLGRSLVIVKIINRGPTNAQVLGVGLEMIGYGDVFCGDAVPLQPLLPTWLEPGEQLDWKITPAAVRKFALLRGAKFPEVEPYASLGDGRIIKGKSRTINGKKGIQL